MSELIAKLEGQREEAVVDDWDRGWNACLEACITIVREHEAKQVAASGQGVDEECEVCGIGFFLPSGRCDHCNCLRTPPATLSAEERERVVEAMAIAIYILQPETYTSPRTDGSSQRQIRAVPFAEAANRDNALAKAEAALAELEKLCTVRMRP